MRNLSRLILMLASFAAPLAMANDAKIEIISPVEGARLNASAENKMDYNVTLGGERGHIHVYVDGKEVAVLRQAKGSYAFDPLEKGDREICIKIVNKAHTPTGVERCIKVTVE